MANDRGKSVGPPADLNDRKLWLRGWRPKVLWRIHRTTFEPCFFSEDVGNRFSSPGIGVLYLGDAPATALWEVFWDDLRSCHHSARLIGRTKLEERTICSATVGRRLRVFNATNAKAMKAVSAPTATFSVDYDNCQAWARALFAHPEKPDGILYPSARTPGVKCLALFAGRVTCSDLTFANRTLLVDNTELMKALVDEGVSVIR